MNYDICYMDFCLGCGCKLVSTSGGYYCNKCNRCYDIYGNEISNEYAREVEYK